MFRYNGRQYTPLDKKLFGLFSDLKSQKIVLNSAILVYNKYMKITIFVYQNTEKIAILETGEKYVQTKTLR